MGAQRKQDGFINGENGMGIFYIRSIISRVHISEQQFRECFSREGGKTMKKHICNFAVIIVLMAVMPGAASAQTFLFQDLPKDWEVFLMVPVGKPAE